MHSSLLRRGWLAITCLVLASCASIPLSTLWQMRNFDAADLAAVQPRDLRLAGLVDPAPMRIDAARSKLELQLTPRIDGMPMQTYRFGLRETQVFDARLNPGHDGRWQVFALDDRGIQEWVKLQPKLQDIKRDYRAAKFEFVFHTADGIPANVNAMIVSAKLQLRIDQAPLLLLDHARVPVQYRADR